jgi:hypothetical protein
VNKSGRKLSFWSPSLAKSSPDGVLLEHFRVLPALFGGKIPSMPFRVIAAYPQDTACNIKGLGILATRAAVLVRRGGCSFGVKMK